MPRIRYSYVNMMSSYWRYVGLSWRLGAESAEIKVREEGAMWSSTVPIAVAQDLFQWIQKRDFLRCRRGEYAATDCSDVRIEWPMTDSVQAFFDYYTGVEPEEKRVAELMSRLDKVAKKYALEKHQEPIPTGFPAELLEMRYKSIPKIGYYVQDTAGQYQPAVILHPTFDRKDRKRHWDIQAGGWYGKVPVKMTKQLQAWIKEKDFLSCRVESATASGPHIRIEWPVNEIIQTYLDYPAGAVPEEKRVEEFIKRLDGLTKQYATQFDEWVAKIFES